MLRKVPAPEIAVPAAASVLCECRFSLAGARDRRVSVFSACYDMLIVLWVPVCSPGAYGVPAVCWTRCQECVPSMSASVFCFQWEALCLPTAKPAQSRGVLRHSL